MKRFWDMVNQLKAIDGMAERITTSHNCQVAFAPIELKDHEVVKKIVKKAFTMWHDGNDIIYAFKSEYNPAKKYFLHLEKR